MISCSINACVVKILVGYIPLIELGYSMRLYGICDCSSEGISGSVCFFGLL